MAASSRTASEGIVPTARGMVERRLDCTWARARVGVRVGVKVCGRVEVRGGRRVRVGARARGEMEVRVKVRASSRRWASR